MPDIIPLFKIEQPQNTVRQLMRPQLVNNSLPCTITILPERVDIETEEKMEIDVIMEYFRRLIEMFELKISRIALYVTTLLDDLTESEAAELKNRLTPPENYSGEENLVEYASHRVARKKFECMDEVINVGRNIAGIPVMEKNQLVISRVQVETDINTLSEDRRERFHADSCREFFGAAAESSREIINNVMEVIHAGDS